MSYAHDPNDVFAGTPPHGAAPTPVRRRHALGLPAGSVRALLALSVLGLLAAIVFLGKEKEQDVQSLYAYLWFMLFLIVASFFASHGATIGVPQVHDKSPLGLPRGSVRFLLIAGFGAIVGWLYHTHRLFEEPPTLPAELLLLMPAGFFVGWFIGLLVRTASREPQGPYWFQDLEAWVAIIAMVMLVVDLMIHLVVNPSMAPENRINLPRWEGALAAIVSFYFGTRT